MGRWSTAQEAWQGALQARAQAEAEQELSFLPHVTTLVEVEEAHQGPLQDHNTKAAHQRVEVEDPTE